MTGGSTAHLHAVILECRTLLHHLSTELDLLQLPGLARKRNGDALVDGLCLMHRENSSLLVTAVGAHCDAEQVTLRYQRGSFQIQIMFELGFHRLLALHVNLAATIAVRVAYGVQCHVII